MLIRFFLKNTARYPLGTTIFGLVLTLFSCFVIVVSVIALTHASDSGNASYEMGSALVGLIMGIVLTIRGFRAMATRKALELQELARAQRKALKAERKKAEAKRRERRGR